MADERVQHKAQFIEPCDVNMQSDSHQQCTTRNREADIEHTELPTFSKISQENVDNWAPNFLKGGNGEKLEGRTKISVLNEQIVLDRLELFSTPKLAEYNGQSREDKKIYIGVAGIVFDMTSAPDFYGPGAAYAIFAGRDATVNLGRSSLLTSTIGSEAKDVGMTAEDLECLCSWIAKYKQKYPIVGRIESNSDVLEMEPCSRKPTNVGDAQEESECTIS